ncbi:hypothetical protein GCM10008967_15910 [Bacillus carboniphilus]|uniref:Anti-sigma K factor RskA C-terminal domain-containing protein n=1 Tax=Bacillus carboniphilus TaxID=86663 RepID=A0ABP3FX46_9BACI
MGCNHWSDEQMIDYILDNHDPFTNESINHSIKECPLCQNQYHQWISILPTKEETLQPSEKLKQRILKSFTSLIKRKRRKVNFPMVAFRTASIATAAFILVIVFWMKDTASLPMSHPSDEPIFVMNNDTSIYELVPHVNHNMKGYAWINERTKELYLFVDGLVPIHDKDYQAWVKTSNQIHDAGVLQLMGESGQLYIKSDPINHAEYIILSIEPKGGSKSPSEKDSWLIKLNAK